MSKNLKLVKRIAAVATTVCVVAGLMVSASAYGITEPAGGFVYDGTQESITVPVTGTSSSGQVTIVVRKDGTDWLTDPNSNVIFIDQVTGAEGSTSITFGIDSKWLNAPGEYKVFVGGSSQAVTSATLTIGGDPVELVSIAVAADAKTVYTQGDAFVAPAVTATYSNGSTKTVTATFSGYDMNTVGTQTVIATYEGKTATYEITVEEATPIEPGVAELVAQYSRAFDLADKTVIEAKIAAENNGNKKVMVGDAELYYNADRGLYVGIVDAANVSGTTISNVAIADEAPTAFVYGNVNNDAKGTVNNGDLLVLKLYVEGMRELDNIALISADVTGDGRAVNSDVLQFKLYMDMGTPFGILSR